MIVNNKVSKKWLGLRGWYWLRMCHKETGKIARKPVSITTYGLSIEPKTC
jgi:hypothetical protein